MQEFGTVPILETPTYKYGIPEISKPKVWQVKWSENRVEVVYNRAFGYYILAKNGGSSLHTTFSAL